VATVKAADCAFSRYRKLDTFPQDRPERGTLDTSKVPILSFVRRHSGLPAVRLLAILAAAACALVLAATPAGATTLSSCNARERALLDAMNAARAEHGLGPLRMSDKLNKAATRHSNSMGRNGYMSHDLYTPSLPDNWTPLSTWLRWYWPGPGYTSWRMGENIAWGVPDLSKRDAMGFWMNSPGHRANILGDFNRVGISAVRVQDPTGSFREYDSMTIWSVDFGKRS
jgi:uncharacterized protein YkwD